MYHETAKDSSYPSYVYHNNVRRWYGTHVNFTTVRFDLHVHEDLYNIVTRYILDWR